MCFGVLAGYWNKACVETCLADSQQQAVGCAWLPVESLEL